MGPNDTGGYCECEHCRRLLDGVAEDAGGSPVCTERVRLFRLNHDCLDAFLKMLAARNNFDFGAAQQHLDRLYALTDTWDFLIDPSDVGEFVGWYRDGRIGGNWQSMRTKTASWSDQGLHYYKGLAWYRGRWIVRRPFLGLGVRKGLTSPYLSVKLHAITGERSRRGQGHRDVSVSLSGCRATAAASPRRCHTWSTDRP